MAGQLAARHYFGEEVMATNTDGTLDPIKMNLIKAIVLSKFEGKKSKEDDEVIWARCKTAIGQKCKQLRAARRPKY